MILDLPVRKPGSIEIAVFIVKAYKPTVSIGSMIQRLVLHGYEPLVFDGFDRVCWGKTDHSVLR